MITAEEEKYVLTSAYVPEHIVGLMTRVSGGEPFLIEDYFCCRKDDWIIVVGYPLQRDFSINEFETVIDKIIKRFHPVYASLIAPELPLSLVGDSVVLSAWDKKDHLSAFYIVDLAAKNFSTYVIGCHSKKNYVPGASDLLFFEMINLSKEYGKDYIHLGLGVNKGIRQFKKKWGGIPTRRYEMCELVVRRPSILDAFMAMGQKL